MIKLWISKNQMGILCVGGMLGICLLVVGCLFLTTLVDPIQLQGEILGKIYTPSSSSSGSGVVIGSDGKPGVVVASSHQSETWKIILRNKDGDIDSYEVSPSVFYSINIGDNVILSCNKGKIIPSIYCDEIKGK